MTREIKFRGRNINGEWVYGNLLKLSDAYMIIPIFNEFNEVPDNSTPAPLMFYKDEFYIVYPNTVGQFTGQKDKNGREIYEGDILEYTNPITGVNLVKGYIVYDCNLCAFQFKNKKNQQYYMNPCNGNQEAMTIIGNIYDNPELLKGGEV